MSSWKAEAVPDGEGENDPENKKNTIKRMTSSKNNNKTSNENEENDVTVVVDGRTSLTSSLTFDAVLASIKRFSLESDFESDLISQRRLLTRNARADVERTRNGFVYQERVRKTRN